MSDKKKNPKPKQEKPLTECANCGAEVPVDDCTACGWCGKDPLCESCVCECQPYKDAMLAPGREGAAAAIEGRT
jgi:hypothetical protein